MLLMDQAKLWFFQQFIGLKQLALPAFFFNGFQALKRIAYYITWGKAFDKLVADFFPFNKGFQLLSREDEKGVGGLVGEEVPGGIIPEVCQALSNDDKIIWKR